jgi:aldehyde dehydrogenase (NAD+)
MTLELGGKSPCIIHSSADLPAAARRVVFGKFLNCGQTCIAPDYVLCQESVREEFLRLLRLEIERQYGKEYKYNLTYGRIVSKKHFDRLLGLMDRSKIFLGGGSDRESLRIEPTVMENVTWEDAVMGEEIFGPILPVLTYSDIREVIDTVRSHEKPLALYLFARDKAVIDTVTTRCQFGGGCINDVIVHLATSEMPFGGVGESGMGSYHGQAGFGTFTHYKSILRRGPVDLPMRYQPYGKLSEKLIRLFLK